MRIVHISRKGSPTDGAAIAMIRLHEALLDIGMDSIVVCAYESVVKKSIRAPQGIKWWVTHYLLRLQSGIGKLLFKESFGLNLIPRGIAKYVNALKPNAVILHWIQGNTISFGEICRIQAPVYWCLHDVWPMCGTEVTLKNEWYKRGYPKKFRWVDRWMWQRKKRVIHRKSISAIVASEWLKQKVKGSLSFQGQKVYYLPLVLGEEFFSDMPTTHKTERRKENGMVNILFVASSSGLEQYNKGFDRFKKALELLNPDLLKRIQVKIAGCCGNSFKVRGVECSFLGNRSLKQMVELYKSVDMLSFPSRCETFGQVKLEALAAGLPVVVFNETACAEGIEHRVTGWVATENDCKSFAMGIEWAASLKGTEVELKRCRESGREYALRCHSGSKVVKGLIKQCALV